MARAEMFPALKTLVDQLAGSYPLDPQNKILPRYIAEWEPRKVGALFTNTLTIFREAVDVEHELSLQTRTVGIRPPLVEKLPNLATFPTPYSAD